MISRKETNQQPLKIGRKKIVYKDFNRVIYRIIAQFDGFNKEYFVSKYGVRAALIVEKSNRILLSRQYRLILNTSSFEIPGGKVEKKESEKEAAIRECFEETGVKTKNIKKLTAFHQGLDVHDSITKVYFANQVLEDRNINNRVWVPIEDCLKMISSGRIIDDLSVIAILTYYHKNTLGL